MNKFKSNLKYLGILLIHPNAIFMYMLLFIMYLVFGIKFLTGILCICGCLGIVYLILCAFEDYDRWYNKKFKDEPK